MSDLRKCGERGGNNIHCSQLRFYAANSDAAIEKSGYYCGHDRTLISEQLNQAMKHPCHHGLLAGGPILASEVTAQTSAQKTR